MEESTSAVDRSGLQVMVTESGSSYLLDLGRMQLLRVPGAVPPYAAEAISGALRRDTEWIKILHIQQLKVGARAVFVLEPLGDPATVFFTTRITTEGQWIRPADEVLL